MKTARIAVSVLLIFLSLCLSAQMWIDAYNNKKGGKNTAASMYVTERAKQDIAEKFGHCETPEQLLAEMTRFAAENFTYDKKYAIQLPTQTFIYDNFLNNNYSGICYDFSMWGKVTALYWAQLKGIEMQAFVFDVKMEKGGNHSYNWYTFGSETYHADYTSAVTERSNGGDYSKTLFSIGERDKMEYAKTEYKDKVYNIH